MKDKTMKFSYFHGTKRISADEYIEFLQTENTKLKQDNEQLRRTLNFKEELDKREIPYEWHQKSVFDLIDEITKLKQDKQELQKIVEALEMAKQNMPKGTQFVIVAEEDYLRYIRIINERSKLGE